MSVTRRDALKTIIISVFSPNAFGGPIEAVSTGLTQAQIDDLVTTTLRTMKKTSFHDYAFQIDAYAQYQRSVR